MKQERDIIQNAANDNKPNYWLPILFSMFLAIGMLLGTYFNPRSLAPKDEYEQKIEQVLGYIENAYVDTPNKELLVENAIQNMLTELDPYSAYISAKDLAHANEQLDGNFDGIGVEFNIINDTVTILHVIPGGPSEKLGLLPGDQIVLVENESIAGQKLKNTDIVRKLKGPKNTVVNISVKRKSEKELLDFKITRAEIKIESVVAVYMANSNTGYIKVTRFAANTADDFHNAIAQLQNNGAQHLVVDLRGNPGGYLGAATKMVDEFLEKNEMITYTEGRARSREEHLATGKGSFKQGKLCVLINEGSASASEIFSGAIQDLDRGLVIGQRSHGKGLVQEPIELRDGSQIRLTVARYYTPAGRCIQRPYDLELKNGQNDSLAKSFKTKNGRKVLEGGGIIPDIIVNEDSSALNDYYVALLRKGTLYEYTMDYHNSNREKLLKSYPNQQSFIAQYNMPSSVSDSLAKRLDKLKINYTENDKLEANERVSNQFKALIARYLYGEEAFYIVINSSDASYLKALQTFEKEDFSLLKN